MHNIVYSLVIPCYNEAGNLRGLVDRCLHLINEREDIEVILINNGSTDNTVEELDDLLLDSHNPRLRSLHIDVNKGYGFGILCGLKQCSGEILGWTHADLQTDPVDFLAAISFFDKKNDLGFPFVKGKRLGRSFRDLVFTWGMSLVEWFVLDVRMWDINAQPTVFSKDFFLSWQEAPNDFSLDLFVYYEAIRMNLIVKRFPVVFDTRHVGEGHNETFSSKFKYSWKTLCFSYGLRGRIKRHGVD